MINKGDHSVLGIRISAVDYDFVVDRVVDAARHGRRCAVSALAVHGVMTGHRDPVHQGRLNGLDLNVPDGQPVRWALGWLHGVHLPDRVYGPTLMRKVIGAAEREHLPVYFYGSRPETIDRLLRHVREAHPGLQVAGAEPSRFRRLEPREKRELVERIRASGARIVFVGLGCPRQEVWAYEYREYLAMPILAVGAAFDFHARTRRQAPGWMQDRGLEWMYRLTQEPARLWKRYLLLNPAFLLGLALQRVGAKTNPAREPDGNAPEESYG